MATKKKVAYSPLILRYHYFMDAFSKSDDERDFYLNKTEGFLLFLDLGRDTEELARLEAEIESEGENFCLLPKLTFYEQKKIMEGFVHEKVYDIDTKEKLLDIISSKEPREHFLEFIHDLHHELEKWHQYYQERSRIRIIEWLRNHEMHFVFEEDLDLPLPSIEKAQSTLFQAKVAKDVTTTRKALETKAKSYYSNEALNPRPKRGRPPKQVTKVEVQQQFSNDYYQTVSSAMRPFLYCPNITSASSVTFSAKFDSEEELTAHLESDANSRANAELQSLNSKLDTLKNLASRFANSDEGQSDAVVRDLINLNKRSAPLDGLDSTVSDVTEERKQEREQWTPEPEEAPPPPKKPATRRVRATTQKKAPAKRTTTKKKAAEKKEETTPKRRVLRRVKKKPS